MTFAISGSPIGRAARAAHGNFDWRCNTGGPSSRTRKERLNASLLGNDEGTIRCPRVTRLALEFGSVDPVRALHRLLRAEGLGHPEELRELFAAPQEPCICLPDSAPRKLAVRDAEPKDVLHQALLLGLCTAHAYDPARPVLWTRTSLTRCLELFDAEGFYA
jgi:hypothetical protein